MSNRNSVNTFNFYINDIDVNYISNLCKNGTLIYYKKGELFCSEGELSNSIGLIQKGVFKYHVRDIVGKEHIVGFAFENTFVANYPACFNNQPATVTIEALTNATVYISNPDVIHQTLTNVRMEQIAYSLFNNIYSNYLDIYRLSPKERYLKLVSNHPHLIQDVSLQDLASYLKITPTYLSKIRKEITFE